MQPNINISHDSKKYVWFNELPMHQLICCKQCHVIASWYCSIIYIQELAEVSSVQLNILLYYVLMFPYSVL